MTNTICEITLNINYKLTILYIDNHIKNNITKNR